MKGFYVKILPLQSFPDNTCETSSDNKSSRSGSSSTFSSKLKPSSSNVGAVRLNIFFFARLFAIINTD